MSTITQLFLTGGATSTLNTEGTPSTPGLFSVNAIYAGDTPLDISGITTAGESTKPNPSTATFVLHVVSVPAGVSASFVLNVGASGALKPVYVINVAGSISPTADKTFRVPWYDIADAQFGLATMLARLDVNVHPTSNTVEYNAWIEY